MENVEKYIKTNELTQAAYNELSYAALKYIDGSAYHSVLKISKSELAHTMVIYVLDRIGKYAPDKQSLGYFVHLKFKTCLFVLWRAATKTQKRPPMVTDEMLIQDGEDVTLFDVISYDRFKSHNLTPTTDREFIKAVAGYWKIKAHVFFPRDSAYYTVASHIIGQLGKGDGVTYKDLNGLKGVGRNHIVKVVKSMSTVNKSLYESWQQRGEL